MNLIADTPDFLFCFCVQQLLKLLERHLKFEWTTQDSLTRLLPNSETSDSETSGSETSGSETSQIKARRNSESTVIPTTAELNQLLQLTMEGDIREVLSKIEQWQQNRPQLMSSIQEMRRLAQTCQLRKLKELIKQYLEQQ